MTNYLRGAAKDRPPRAPQRLCQLPTDRQKYPDFVTKLSLAVSRFASPTGLLVEFRVRRRGIDAFLFISFEQNFLKFS